VLAYCSDFSQIPLGFDLEQPAVVLCCAPDNFYHIWSYVFHCHLFAFPKFAANMSSRKTAGRRVATKKRAQRATSNVFAMFDQAQIQEFKEAFNMIDQNRDGFVDKEDLHDMLASLGNLSQIVLDEVTERINYFLTENLLISTHMVLNSLFSNL
jgi:EF-hand domain